MRIGYLYDLKAFPPKGGNHRHAYELTQGFIKHGHKVLVIDDPTMPGVTNYDGTVNDINEFIENIDLLYVRIDARFIRKWDVLIQCMEIIGSQPVIWEINSPANESLAYSWLGGNLSLQNSKKEGRLKKLKRWFHAFRKQPGIYFEESFRRKMAIHVSSAICVSKAVGNYAEQDLGIKNVIILPNGGPLITEEEIGDREKLRKSDAFTVLYSGSAIYPWQGLNYLTEVISLAETEAPDISFIIAVNQSTPNLPSSKNVVIREGLPQEEVRDAICAADVCLALIPEWTWAKYGFHGSPTKLFEYMAFKRAVLTSNHGQMSEILNDDIDAILCTNNPRDILDRLLLLRSDREHVKKIGYKGWERIQSEFNWGYNVKETLKTFEQILHD